MEQTNSMSKSLQKNKMESKTPAVGLRIPVVTNNTELDTLLYLLPFLREVKEGRQVLDKDLAQAFLKVMIFFFNFL